MDINKLNEILLELRSASMQAYSSKSENEYKSLLRKYDMLFIGEKFNHIYSAELRHSLENYFHIEIENDELNNLIPVICKDLNMNYEPMVEVSKIGKSTAPDQYEIILW